MKVVHISTSLSGGAGICASRIMEETRAKGIDARAIVLNGEKSAFVDAIQYHYPWSSYSLIRKVQVFLSTYGIWPKAIKNCNRISKAISKERQKYIGTYTFTSPISIYKEIVSHPWIKDADIVHLHWVGNFLDYESFFNKIRKPIVWTIHDENPGLGGFHYRMWKEAAPASFKDLDEQFMKLKEAAYSHVKTIYLVALSCMMKDYFKTNRLLSKFPVEIIHNGINGDSFYMLPNNIAKQVLSIPEDKVVFLFASQDIHEDRKGLKELVAALEKINKKNILLICLGRYQFKPVSLFEIRCEGFVSNSRLLSLYYSAADYYIMPSFQEAFAQTPMESMACGTPVIAFPCSGTKDLINEVNGVVCEDFTIDALYKGMLEAMNKEYDRELIRNDVLSRFSYDLIANQYIELYKKAYCN